MFFLKTFFFIPQIVLLLSIAPLHAQGGMDQQKAAMLLSLCKYTEWPSDKLPSNAYITIGVYGSDAIFDRINEAKPKQIDGHPVLVKRITAIQEIDGCHALFVGRSQDSNVRDILRRAGRDTLTFGETQAFMNRGGLFFFDKAAMEPGNMVQTYMDQRALKRSYLKINAYALEAMKAKPMP